MSTEQWRTWPRGEEGSPETQGKYTDRYEHVHFTATSGLPAVAEGMCWERSDSLSGGLKEGLENETKNFTPYGSKQQSIQFSITQAAE